MSSVLLARQAGCEACLAGCGLLSPELSQGGTAEPGGRQESCRPGSARLTCFLHPLASSLSETCACAYSRGSRAARTLPSLCKEMVNMPVIVILISRGATWRQFLVGSLVRFARSQGGRARGVEALKLSDPSGACDSP